VLDLNSDDGRKFLAQLKRHEGAKRNLDGRHIAYRCPAGALTIGYGHNLDANPVPGIAASSQLTDDQADRLLSIDVQRYAEQLDLKLPWAKDLDAPRYAVLLNMAFNMGLSGLLGFKNTLGMIKAGQYASAGAGMLESKWAKQVKGRAVELSRQMTTGKWASI
jgi:lysozyme